MGVRVPQLKNLRVGITLYYSRLELSNTDIKALFGGIGSARIVSLKRLVKESMPEGALYLTNPLYVNTKYAFKAWGLDIEEIEKNYNRLIKLGLAE